MAILRKIESYFDHPLFEDLALFVVRVAFGASMFLLHGLGKLERFGELSTTFPDPLGLGSPLISLVLALVGEFVAPLFLIVGLLTRFAAVPAAITMGVAAFIIHAQDLWQKKELALLYFAAFLVLIFKGAGRISLDYFRRKV